MTRKIVTTSMSEEDWEFCKHLGIPIAHLLRWAVEQRRSLIDGSASYTEEKRKREAFQRLSERYRDFIRKNGLEDKWFEENAV